ncbi:MAG: UvrD-helicase domain-containing protein [Myxococcaceae bacterium]|nr:UvrD-helicase domain-containing protein [Myxococcaceae bacterium]
MAARRRPTDSQLGFDFGALPVPRNTPPPPPPPPPDEATPLERALRLEANLALFAGAGAGKTWSLITLCLHVLGGARAGHEPVPPANLCLLTFTDKAAAEMRQRLRERLDRLATGAAKGEQRELELETSFAALGRPLPPPAFWRAVRDELGAASIGTFHSVMTQLLRRAPAGSGVNPSFELLEERDARRLFAERVERVVLARLEQGDAHVRELVRDFGFGADNPWGLVSSLVRVSAAIREEGTQVELVPVQDRDEAGAAFLATVRGLRLQALTLQRSLDVRDTYRARVDELCRRLSQVTLETWPEHRELLDETVKHWRRDDVVPLRDALRGKGDGSSGPGALYAAWKMAPFDMTVRELVKEAIASYESALDDLGALDFTALLVRARDLLRSSPDARLEAHRRFKVVLVDEFQDTNRVQLELVLLLAERREGAPRPLSRELGEGPNAETLEVPLEPAALAVVGDRKQAIYDFRGADVAVFERMARCIEASGGQRQFLQQSRRSTAAIVELCNEQSQHFLVRDDPTRSSAPFEVEFDRATDALTAVRTNPPPGPALVRLGLPSAIAEADAPPPVEALRNAEAEALARWLAQTLSSPDAMVTPRAPKHAPSRAIVGGDVAVLFQRFTQLETYRQALVRHGVRHRIVRGRGFYAAQEVVDLASLLQLIADPAHVVAFAAVLRSPLVGLSDTALVALALDGAQVVGLDPRGLLLDGRGDFGALDEGERARLSRFIDVWQVLSRERDRLGPRQLLRVALDALEYRVAIAAAPFGEQALANLDKLLELATAREAQGVPIAELARELLELADTEPKEAQGEVLDEGDTEAVTLLTVHQAKGLEWAVVVVPELFVTSPPGGERVRFDRDVGLAVAPLANEPVGSARYLQCRALKTRREDAQRRRLLYVALTRARDRLVLGFQPENARSTTWASWLRFEDFWWQQFHDRGDAVELDVDALPPGRPPPTPGLADEDTRRALEALVARVKAPPLVPVRDVMLPVTQLQDFVSCPQRFHLAHQVGLAERPVSFEWAEERDDEPPAGDARVLGTATHKLLELAPLEWVAQPGLAARLASLQRTSGLATDRDDQVRGWALRFLESPYGARLPKARRVLRELPFVLRLGDGDFSLHLRGQIDLLVIDEAVEVVDYKTTTPSPAGLEPYRFQLGCYVLAARRFVRAPGVEVRAGISFLKHDDPSPRFFEALPDEGALERELVAQAKALVTAQATRAWAQRPLERCAALGCGYRLRCHGAKEA